jgi:hypothetical protein
MNIGIDMNLLLDTSVAWQKQIRDRRKQENSDSDLLGDWWSNINVDIKKGEIKEVPYLMAKKIIEDYEWLGCMPAVVWHSYGIFFDGHCAGVVCYSPEYSENLGKISREKGTAGADWSKYGYEGKMILLSRGACVHWAHPHSASKLIRQSMKMLPKKYEIVTATVDEAAGEIGTIYQACGFHYVGSMRDSNPNVKSRKLDRDGWLINGKIWTARSIRSICGDTKIENIKNHFPNVVKVKQHSKGRYFAFTGSKRTQQQHFKAIEHLIKPYTKRQKVN